MKRFTALVLLAIAVGAIIHFWPSGERQSAASPVSQSAPKRDSPGSTSNSATVAQGPPTSAPSAERPARSGLVERPSDTPARFEIRAPVKARRGETFPVTIEVQALRGIRQLEFSVTYKQTILQLVRSSPGAFAQQRPGSVHFEEVSDGSLLVRLDLESSVIAGAGTLAVVEFQAIRAGVSPLAVEGVTFVEDGRKDQSNMPTAYEGSITVE